MVWPIKVRTKIVSVSSIVIWSLLNRSNYWSCFLSTNFARLLLSFFLLFQSIDCCLRRWLIKKGYQLSDLLWHLRDDILILTAGISMNDLRQSWLRVFDMTIIQRKVFRYGLQVIGRKYEGKAYQAIKSSNFSF